MPDIIGFKLGFGAVLQHRLVKYLDIAEGVAENKVFSAGCEIFLPGSIRCP